MNTDTLIHLLSREPIEARAMSFGIRLTVSLLPAVLVSVLLTSLVLGIQTDLIQKMATVFFWLKFSFALTLFLAGALIVIKAAKPGKASSNDILMLSVPVITVWLIAAWTVLQPSAPEILTSVEGSSWKVCSLLIAWLSMPIFIATFWSLRYMASTRPRFSGFMAGLFSGGLAACIYCLHCPELSPVFVGVWYLLGILIPAGIGAVLGKWLLRW